jgi:hypothetical protein
MSYVLDDMVYGIGDPPTSALYAKLRVGSDVGADGTTSGDPNYELGDGSGTGGSAFYNWDNNLTDGFDSGSMSVNFRAASSGAESLSVGSGPLITYSGSSFSSIGGVIIDAGVEIPAEVRWSSISVKFYRSGVLQETDLIGVGPDANTVSTPATPAAQQTLTVTSTHSGINKVIVSGTVQMTAPAGTIPGQNDMFANVYVQTA